MHEENESTQKSPKKWVMCGVHTEERRETAATSPLVWCSDKANAACISLFHVSSVGSIFCDHDNEGRNTLNGRTRAARAGGENKSGNFQLVLVFLSSIELAAYFTVKANFWPLQMFCLFSS